MARAGAPGAPGSSETAGDVRQPSIRHSPTEDRCGPVSGIPVYLANHDARARVTHRESGTYRGVHRLDQINAKKPAKLLDSKSLTLSFSYKQNLAGFYTCSWGYRKPSPGSRLHYSQITGVGGLMYFAVKAPSIFFPSMNVTTNFPEIDFRLPLHP